MTSRRFSVARVIALVAAIAIALTACTPASEPGGPGPTGPTRDYFPPGVGATFHIQYSGPIDMDQQVEVYNLDGDATTQEQVQELRDRGVAPVCYFNAGGFEDWRADRGTFPREVIGKPLDGWPGEYWLDVRELDVLIPIMAARMEVCADKGFVGVDPDNTDGWLQDTGFALKAGDQIAYQRALADEAHKRGLAIGLKNNPDQLPEIGPFVDFAVNEQCVEYEECDAYIPFLASGKPVFTIEYSGDMAEICRSVPPGMSVIRKDLALSAGASTC